MSKKYRLVLKGSGVSERKAKRIRQLCITAPAMLEDLRSGVAAAQFVLDNWSQGDLAAAVNGLEEWAEGARATIAEATRRKP